MSPKEKAIDLIDDFIQGTRKKWELSMSYKRAKDCALITVNAILKVDIYKSDQYYFEEVKKEIQK